jgi:hypothetical protein
MCTMRVRSSRRAGVCRTERRAARAPQAPAIACRILALWSRFDQRLVELNVYVIGKLPVPIRALALCGGIFAFATDLQWMYDTRHNTGVTHAQHSIESLVRAATINEYAKWPSMHFYVLRWRQMVTVLLPALRAASDEGVEQMLAPVAAYAACTAAAAAPPAESAVRGVRWRKVTCGLWFIKLPQASSLHTPTQHLAKAHHTRLLGFTCTKLTSLRSYRLTLLTSQYETSHSSCSAAAPSLAAIMHDSIWNPHQRHAHGTCPAAGAAP